MPDNSRDPQANLDRKKRLYLERIAQIDRILRLPVNTLLGLAPAEPRKNDSDKWHFPAILSAKAAPAGGHSPHSQAVCFATIQKLWRLRRRFPFLTHSSNERLAKVKRHLIEWFLPQPTDSFFEVASSLESRVLGNLNPLTASNVFRVLLEAGEGQAHSGLGFLAIFAIIWPLFRRHPDRLSAGARIERGDPSAYITLNCILPILKVRRVASHRTRLLRQIKDHVHELQKTLKKPNKRNDWLFCLTLDHLSRDLRRLARVSLIRRPLETLAHDVASLSCRLSSTAPNPITEQAAHDFIVKGLAAAVVMIGEHSEQANNTITKILAGIEKTIVHFLATRCKMDGVQLNETSEDELVANGLNLQFSREYIRDKDYWCDLLGSAESALKFCEDVLRILERAAIDCKTITADTSWDGVERVWDQLIKANADIVEHLTNKAFINEAGRWCRTIMDRETAHASAGNLTDFDPAELVSAIGVAVRLKHISTRLQVSDAVAKALIGAHKDGSWRQALPFFSPDSALGMSPVTSEIVWGLTGAIQQEPDVTVADATLFRYLDWLERTQIVRQGGSVAGWASDRMRRTEKIHLLSTAFSINALLEIRDLVEYRLWQLCEQRFAAISVTKGLEHIDPVDLGLPHHERLHHHLARMVAETQGDQHESASTPYSLILHGPPGSSKTKIAEALSVEMWTECRRWGRRQPRFIRITPADFTRMGEDRLDSEARLIFDLLSHVRGVTIFFDEIDDLLRRRKTDPDHRPTFMELVVPAMLNRLADLREACPRQETCFLLATNYVENIEAALIRPGRIDLPLPVVYPDWASRIAILHRHMALELQKTTRRWLDSVESTLPTKWAAKTPGWPWMVLDKACKQLVGALPKSDGTGQQGDADSAVIEKDISTILDEVIHQYKGDFQPPQYDARKKNGNGCKPFANEYARYEASLVIPDH